MTLAEKLADAEAAHHDLMVGRAALIFVDQNGERVEYNRASAPKLAAYISELKRKIAGKPRPAVVRFQTSKGLT
ncbi:MAG: gpW family head-tail joining protein [Pseudomonadota bacterium]